MKKINQNKEDFVDSVDIDKEYRVENIRQYYHPSSKIAFDIVNKKDGRRGEVEYGLDADAEDNGIIFCSYEEGPDEDIYETIHDFVYDYIDYIQTPMCDGKRIRVEK